MRIDAAHERDLKARLRTTSHEKGESRGFKFQRGIKELMNERYKKVPKSLVNFATRDSLTQQPQPLEALRTLPISSNIRSRQFCARRRGMLRSC